MWNFVRPRIQLRRGELDGMLLFVLLEDESRLHTPLHTFGPIISSQLALSIACLLQSSFSLNYIISHPSLVGSLVIGDKLSIEDHGSMSPTVIGSELEPHDSITDPQIRLNWW
jgi:hypothetical protein